MRVRIYGKGQSVVVEDVDYVHHVNAVEGLCVAGPIWSGLGMEAQARSGQLFVLSDHHLRCFEAGHETLAEGDEIVWDPRPGYVEVDCPNCGKTITVEGE